MTPKQENVYAVIVAVTKIYDANDLESIHKNLKNAQKRACETAAALLKNTNLLNANSNSYKYGTLFIRLVDQGQYEEALKFYDETELCNWFDLYVAILALPLED